jgi:hypothetical protein
MPKELSEEKRGEIIDKDNQGEIIELAGDISQTDGTVGINVLTNDPDPKKAKKKAEQKAKQMGNELWNTGLQIKAVLMEKTAVLMEKTKELPPRQPKEQSNNKKK